MPENSDIPEPTEAQLEEARKELTRCFSELQVYAKKATCIMCGKPAETIGLWAPDTATRKMLNEPKDRTRIVVYGMCLDCLSTKPQDEFLKVAEAQAFHIAHGGEKAQS